MLLLIVSLIVDDRLAGRSGWREGQIHGRYQMGNLSQGERFHRDDTKDYARRHSVLNYPLHGVRINSRGIDQGKNCGISLDRS